MMTALLLQTLLLLAVLGLLTPFLGKYLSAVLRPGAPTGLERLAGSLEKWIYGWIGADRMQEQTWKQYLTAAVAFFLLGLGLLFVLVLSQGVLPWNPQRVGGPSWHLALNTAVSFATHTNWQSAAGEGVLSPLAQMVGLVVAQFAAAASSICIAAAVGRSFRRSGMQTLGNFWVDLVRVTLYLLLPLALLYAVFLVSQGVVQSWQGPLAVQTLEGARGWVGQGPVASQTAIEILGANGGGYFAANAAHPLQNPTPLSNFTQMLAMLLIPSGLIYWFGLECGDRKHAWSLWTASALLLILAAVVCFAGEARGNPLHHVAGLAGANWEGQELRFGVPGSALYAAVTTATSCGATNAAHGSFTPLGQLPLFFNLHFGGAVFGGAGSGLYNLLVYVILTIFLAGLMIGRTPEYLGNRLEAIDVRRAALVLLVLNFSVLGLTAVSAASAEGRRHVSDRGPHGFAEILYAHSSCAANNGSAMGGLDANNPYYNLTLAAAMLVGRWAPIALVLALAGGFAAKRVPVSPAAGRFPSHGPLFIGVLTATMLMVGALSFLPALALGPLVEQFLMHAGALY